MEKGERAVELIPETSYVISVTAEWLVKHVATQVTPTEKVGSKETVPYWN